MSRYWIRNRGRTTGPFTAEKLQSLARRGRFNRHFQVSRDKKNWSRATEFPELFAQQQDVVATPQYGSPADDFVEPAPAAPVASTAGKQIAAELDDDDTEIQIAKKKRRPDNDDWDDEAEDDDDEWGDDDEYERASLGEWLSDHVFEFLVVIGLLLIGSFVFYLATRENWKIDEADLAVLVSVRDQIRAAEGNGIAGSNEWNSMRERSASSLADMIARLEETASAKDHIKQELLFTARDDIPKLFDELPAGKMSAAERIEIRLQKVRDMLSARTRQYQGTQVVDSGRSQGFDPEGIEKLKNALRNNGNTTTPAGGDPQNQQGNPTPPSQPPAQSPTGEGGGVGMRRNLPGRILSPGQSGQSTGGEAGGVPER